MAQIHTAERADIAPLPPSPSQDTTPSGPEQPASYTVTPWWDPGLATRGVDPRDPYVERFWLGTLGPSTVLLLRRFARGLDEHPEGFRVGVVDTSLALGLGRGTGRNAPITRTVNRAVSFDMMRRPDPGRLEVRTHLPLLGPRQLRHLPPLQRRLHDEWLRRRTDSSPRAEPA